MISESDHRMVGNAAGLRGRNEWCYPSFKQKRKTFTLIQIRILSHIHSSILLTLYFTHENWPFTSTGKVRENQNRTYKGGQLVSRVSFLQSSSSRYVHGMRLAPVPSNAGVAGGA